MPTPYHPTAEQVAAEVHETDQRVLEYAVCGWGTDSTVHVRPFHDAATTCPPDDPTAIQNDANLQETDWNEMAPPMNVGERVIAQLLPFHTSASAMMPLVLLGSYEPTATHPENEEHETLVDTAYVDRAGRGMECSTQSLPFHASANTLSSP